MANVERYLTGLVDNLENLKGVLSRPENLNGRLSNATLRGERVELRMNDQFFSFVTKTKMILHGVT